jgi:hypothetical protein
LGLRLKTEPLRKFLHLDWAGLTGETQETSLPLLKP